MSIKENVKRAKSDFDEVYEAGIEVGKKIGGESVAPNLQDKYIAENGTYTADSGYDGLGQVEVNVVTEPILQEKTATENGEYTPDEGYDGLSKVTVQVASSGGGDNSKLAKLVSGEEVSLTAGDLSGITTVREAAFKGSKLTDVELPSGITQINKNAFQDCTKLISVTVPEGVITISSYGFANAILLSRVTLPYTLTTISDYVFYGCKALSNIEIPANLTSFGQSAFNGSGITSIVIPRGVPTIANYLFSGCSALTHVTVLGNIKTISTNSFNACTALECLDLTGCTSIPNLTSVNNLSGVPTTCQIKVPARLADSFKGSTNWSTYADQIVAVPFVTIDGNQYNIEEGMTWGEWVESNYNPMYGDSKLFIIVDDLVCIVSEEFGHLPIIGVGWEDTQGITPHANDVILVEDEFIIEGFEY